MQGLRESIDNMNFMEMAKSKEQFGRDHDERMFKEAGTKKMRTFKYDPTKPVQISFKEGKRN